MSQGIKFTIVDKDHGEFEVRFANRIIGGIFFIAIGIIIIALGIWTEFAFGPAWPLYVLGGIVCFCAYFIMAHRERLIIDKAEGNVILKKNFWGLYNSVRHVWAINQVDHFEAKVLEGWVYQPDPVEAIKEGVMEVIDVAVPGTGAGDVADFHKDLYVTKQSVEWGFVILHLKNGEIIQIFHHKYPHAPENSVKHGNLFLNGEENTPGVYSD